MKKEHDKDLGFTFMETKKGDIIINHYGRKAITLRNNRAIEFKEDIDNSTFDEQQQLMARLTGNYKRGNERLAKYHPRNKG
ncbi:MAG: hypothetical protein GY847_23130 [Proteobacteria bacterium]|nr:hypothetical protein [Pseudomonadota bacterium]